MSDCDHDWVSFRGLSGHDLWKCKRCDARSFHDPSRPSGRRVEEGTWLDEDDHVHREAGRNKARKWCACGLRLPLEATWESWNQR